MADELENNNILVEPGDTGQGEEEADFDPMAQFRKAQEKQNGIKHPKPPTDTPPPETQAEEEQGDVSAKEEEGTGNKKTEPPLNPDADLGEEIAETSPTTTTETTAPKVNPNRSSSLNRLVDVSSKALVEKGDRIQQNGAMMLYDFRASESLNAAQSDYDKLFAKVAKGATLNAKELARLNAADAFIKACAAYRKELEQKVPMSQADLDALIEVLTTYYEESNSKPHPLLLLIVLVGGTLFSNFYAAFTMPPKYNPPPL